MHCAFRTRKKCSSLLLAAGVHVTYYWDSGRLSFGNRAYEPVDVVDLEYPELVLGDLRIHPMASINEVESLLSALSGYKTQLEMQNLAYCMFVVQAPIEERLPEPRKQSTAPGKVLPLRKASSRRKAAHR